MISQWSKLPRVWKTEQAVQALNLLKDCRIKARTVPEEFNSEFGNHVMTLMDQDRKWPIYVRARQIEPAIAILKDEHLL